MYSITSTITLECNHDYFYDYFNDYSNTVFTVQATSLESLGTIRFLLLCHYVVF